MTGGSFPLLLLILPLVYAGDSPQPTTTDEPTKTVTEENFTTSQATIICLILNLATIAILYMTLREARRTPELMDKYRLSMHWLSRTAIRHSIGPNAKKILVEYVEKEEKEKKEKKK